MTQHAKATKIDTDILNTEGRKDESNQLATPNEIRDFRSVIGKRLYIGRLTNPVLLYHCSALASKVPALQFRHMKTLKTAVNQHTKSQQKVTFLAVPDGSTFGLQGISDASMATTSEAARGGLMILRRAGDVVHPISWSARKLKRVARSSSTAELLAASDVVNVLAYIQLLLGELLYHHQAEMTFDSRALFNLSTSVHEPVEALNKVDLAAIRELYNPSQVGTISWSPGHYNPTEALTKNNLTTAALLLKILKEGMFVHHPDRLTRTAEQPMIDVNEIDKVSQTGACGNQHDDHSC